MRVWTTFNSRARGRGGKMRLARFLAIAVGSFLGFLFAVPTQTQAQSNSTRNATLIGTLTDPSGAAVAGARRGAPAPPIPRLRLHVTPHKAALTENLFSSLLQDAIGRRSTIGRSNVKSENSRWSQGEQKPGTFA